MVTCGLHKLFPTNASVLRQEKNGSLQALFRLANARPRVFLAEKLQAIISVRCRQMASSLNSKLWNAFFLPDINTPIGLQRSAKTAFISLSPLRGHIKWTVLLLSGCPWAGSI